MSDYCQGTPAPHSRRREEEVVMVGLGRDLTSLKQRLVVLI